MPSLSNCSANLVEKKSTGESLPEMGEKLSDVCNQSPR
jgi:hypothetical protein